MRLFTRKGGVPRSEAEAPGRVGTQILEPPAVREEKAVKRRRRDPIAWLISIATLVTLAILALNWLFVEVEANATNAIVDGVGTISGYLLAPWEDFVSGQSLGVTTIVAGGAYLVAGIAATLLLHRLWGRTIVRRRGVRMA